MKYIEIKRYYIRDERHRPVITVLIGKKENENGLISFDRAISVASRKEKAVIKKKGFELALQELNKSYSEKETHYFIPLSKKVMSEPVINKFKFYLPIYYTTSSPQLQVVPKKTENVYLTPLEEQLFEKNRNEKFNKT